MAMKAYSAFPKASALLEPQLQIVSVISRTTVKVGAEAYSSTEKQLLYSTTLTD